MVVFFILANFFFHSITLAAQYDESLERPEDSELVGVYTSFQKVTPADTVALAVKLKEAQYEISKLDPQTESQKIEEILTYAAHSIDDLFSETDIFKLNKTNNIIDTYIINLGKLSKVPRGEDPKENYTFSQDFEKKYSILNISLTHFYLSLNNDQKRYFWDILNRSIQTSISFYKDGPYEAPNPKDPFYQDFPENFVAGFVDRYADIFNSYYEKYGVEGYLKGSDPLVINQRQIDAGIKAYLDGTDAKTVIANISELTEKFQKYMSYEDVAQNLAELLFQTEILQKDSFQQYCKFIENYLGKFYAELDFTQKTEFDRLMILEILKSFDFNENFKNLLERQTQVEIPQIGLFDLFLPLCTQIIRGEF